MIEIDKNATPNVLGKSRFRRELAQYYALAPSAVLIRVAEAELLSALPMESPALDLCCGDGFFSSLVCPSGFEAGCDINESALHQAEGRNIYQALACADVSQGIPFHDHYFSTVVSNSSLEHVEKIDSALREIGRVLKPGGKLYITLASNYAYEWWPCGQKALKRYLEYQPVFNYFPLAEWERRMALAGLCVIGHQYYLSRTASRLLSFLDYHFSRVYMTADRTLVRYIIYAMGVIPGGIWAALWSKLFAGIKLEAGDKGGGIMIIAEREGNP